MKLQNIARAVFGFFLTVSKLSHKQKNSFCGSQSFPNIFPRFYVKGTETRDFLPILSKTLPGPHMNTGWQNSFEKCFAFATMPTGMLIF